MKLSLILILLLHFTNIKEDSELIKIRNLYENAAIKEEAQVKLNLLLLNIKPESYLLSGYKGANIMIGASYVFNPISKLNKFNKGRKLVEDAIKNEPNNLELRYLRFTLQTNLPRFLGYTNQINRDKIFMINQLGVLKDLDLRFRIVTYLLASSWCNESDLKKLEAWKNK